MNPLDIHRRAVEDAFRRLAAGRRVVALATTRALLAGVVGPRGVRALRVIRPPQDRYQHLSAIDIELA